MGLSQSSTRLMDDLSPPDPSAILTVGAVVQRIRLMVEQQFPTALWIEGELSNCSYPASGHIYFSLVDEKATDRFGQRLILPCVFFRGVNQYLKFKLFDGIRVFCLGQVTTYEGRGQYQLKVLRVEPKGMGALQLAFEQLKRRLAAEGLFDEARKKAIPRFPRRIGVVTSRSGSAIHDIVSKLRGRFDVIILPVKVQGEGSAAEIASMLDMANTLKLADLLIVGRGGGSVEDLWAFNEEPVARAIARSRIPVISAVGHQDDWTICDYVADLRASTPTDAAKRLVQEQQEIVDRCHDIAQQFIDVMQQILDEEESQLLAAVDRLRLLHPVFQLREYERRVLASERSLAQAMHFAIERANQRLTGLCAQLEALSPLAVLSRGYSITFKHPARQVVREASDLMAGDELESLFSKGRIMSTVTQVWD